MQCPTSRPAVMPTLTSLPSSLLQLILGYLCDDYVYEHRSFLQGTTSFLPFRYPSTCHTLDFADAAHATIPEKLIAPALASPVLAAAAANLLGTRLSYLTFLNTEGRLPLWIHAFARHVKAVNAGIVAEKWHPDLPHNLRVLRLNKACVSTVNMFKAITVNYVALQVLDLVHVPFNEFRTMQDELMAGLCATLESSHTTLRELALPVYAKSDLCACALETATLPHLAVFSIELVNVRDPENVSDRRQKRLGRPFLRMMQAVDGHADRSCGLTTLEELRLINLYRVPCTAIRESRCSAGLFRAVRTLRAAMNESVRSTSAAEELEFFALFRKLKYLYWNGTPCRSSTSLAFGVLCEKLREVHLCHRDWITGAQVGAGKIRSIDYSYSRLFEDITEMSCRKIMTLVTYEDLDPSDFWRIAKCCPNLKHLSLFVTQRNLPELGGLIKKCEGLTGLEIILIEEYFERLERRSWLELAKAIPRHHANLHDVAIKTRWAYPRFVAPVDAVIDCLVDVVKRLGYRARRLVFRAGTKSRRLVNLINGVTRILRTCDDRSLGLLYLNIDLIPRTGRKSYDMHALVDAKWDLRGITRSLPQWVQTLGKLDLGGLHFYSKYPRERWRG